MKPEIKDLIDIALSRTSFVVVKHAPFTDKSAYDYYILTSSEMHGGYDLYFYRHRKLVKYAVVQLDGRIFHLDIDGETLLDSMGTINDLTIKEFKDEI